MVCVPVRVSEFLSVLVCVRVYKKFSFLLLLANILLVAQKVGF